MLPRVQEEQGGVQLLTEAAGFATIVIGTFLLHATRDLDVSTSQVSARLPRPSLQASGQVHRAWRLLHAMSHAQPCCQAPGV